jgi:hypothetical protein
MQKFTDDQNREWQLAVYVGNAERVKAETGCDILQLNLADPKAPSNVMDDPYLFAKAIWVLIESQAKERNIDEDNFLLNFTGDSVERAAFALQRAVADFTPSKAKRLAMRAVIDKAVEVGSRMEQEAQEAADKLAAMTVEDLMKQAEISQQSISAGNSVE